MFNKEKFSKILINIVSKYDSISEFAKYSTVGRSYISKYINLKIDAPPTPKVLQKIADASKGVISYYELMHVCDYVDNEEVTTIHNSLSKQSNCNFFTIPIFTDEQGSLCATGEDFVLPFEWDRTHSYFAYIAKDESMAPLLGIGDIAIVEQTNKYETGKTFLIKLDNSILLVRKLIQVNNELELHPTNPYFPIIKLTDNEFETRKFTVLGKIIKIENTSAFK